MIWSESCFLELDVMTQPVLLVAYINFYEEVQESWYWELFLTSYS